MPSLSRRTLGALLAPAGLSPGEIAEGSISYAFVFQHEADESNDGERLRTREVLLMARLCAFDTGHQQFTKFDAMEERSCPPHLQSSDELLALLTRG
eukprot:symbB.v1.2.028000.t1/scaffold2873.1/size134662/1